MMLLRANVLALGFSGVRPEVIDLLCQLLAKRVHPVVPEKGSVGASGDLAPLAHLALSLIGEGEAFTGIMTTAGHLLFGGDTTGNLLALDPATGKTLWHLNLGGNITSSPMTYQLDGLQYVVVAVHDHFYAFSLPPAGMKKGK